MSNTKILFNRPCYTGLDDKYVSEVMKRNRMAGKVYGKFHGIDECTTNESNKIIRLPFYYGITKEEIQSVVSAIYKYWQYLLIIFGKLI